MSSRSKVRRCPVCGAVLDLSTTLCASCGKAVATKEPERCGVCGAQYDPVLEQCPICGAERALAPRGRVSALMTLALGVLALAVVVVLGLRLRPWQNAELDPDKLVSAAMDRLGPTRAPTVASLPPTPLPLPTAELTPTVTPSLTSTPSPTATLAPTLTPSPATEPEEPASQPETHIVRQGDTPLGIAGLYGVSVEALLQANDLDEDAVLAVGQSLSLPRESAGTGAASPPIMEAVTHEVAAGETLLAIAKQYGVDSADIASANGISESSVLQIGQRLEIPAARGGPTIVTPIPDTPAAQRTTLPSPTPTPRPEVLRHTVAKGETLSQIAVLYDVSSEDIAAANGFKVGAVLSIGQELLIPGLAPEATPTSEPSPTPTVTPTVAARAKAGAAAALAPAYDWKYLQPQPLAPLDGTAFAGVGDVPLLSWASVGILDDGEWYRLRVWPTSGVVEATVVWTKNTSWRVDATLCTGERRELNWQVVVATRTEAGEVAEALSEPSTKQSFVWR